MRFLFTLLILWGLVAICIHFNDQGNGYMALLHIIIVGYVLEKLYDK
jgi:hypothetical protein